MITDTYIQLSRAMCPCVVHLVAPSRPAVRSRGGCPASVQQSRRDALMPFDSQNVEAVALPPLTHATRHLRKEYKDKVPYPHCSSAVVLMRAPLIFAI